MNQYVTGTVIRELREKNQLTQRELAEKLGVSDKTVSKWETAKGYPDITLLEPIAEVPDDILKDLLDKAYQIVLGSFSKKKQKEILGE